MSCNSCLPSRPWLERARRTAVAALAGLALALACGSAAADVWRQELPRASAIGSGELRWFGLRIYHAALWSEQKPFDPAGQFALQLTYHRSIGRDRLVSTSMDEIRRLGVASRDPAVLRRWEADLRGAFVDVAEGDQLIGVNVPGHGMRLYNRSKLLADIPDPALAQAFFSIWLHKDSRDQGLRRQLLGAQP